MPDLRQEIEKRSRDGGLSCIGAFDLAEALGLPPERIREEADRAEIRIFFCQLGLFGYHGFGEKRFAASLPQVPGRLAGAIRTAAGDGALSCTAAWEIADQEGLPRPVVGSAADALGVRIFPCQLGCFRAPTFGEKHGGEQGT